MTRQKGEHTIRLQSDHRHATQFRDIRLMMQASSSFTVAKMRVNRHRIEYFPAVAFAALVDVGGQRLLSFAAVHPVTVLDDGARWRQQCGRLLGRQEHDCLLLDFHVRPGEREVWDGVSDMDIPISLRMASMLDPYDLPGGCAIEALLEDRRSLYAMAGRRPEPQRRRVERA